MDLFFYCYFALAPPEVIRRALNKNAEERASAEELLAMPPAALPALANPRSPEIDAVKS